MSVVSKDDMCLNKYNEIWDKIEETLSIKFHSIPVYDGKYIKAKVREFNGVIKTNFLSDKVPKENEHLHCLYNYWFCYENGKKYYPQFYLEECKNKMKKTKIIKFIAAELESESASELEYDIKLEIKYDTE